MKTMPAGEFKAKCLKLMDEVQSTREPIIITKNRKPVARLVALPLPARDGFIGRLKGALTIAGDIEAPSNPLADFEYD